jgi:hypothetical protein
MALMRQEQAVIQQNEQKKINEIDGLAEKERVNHNLKIDDLQKQIDAQDRADGLEGDGLIDDKPQKNVIMS